MYIQGTLACLLCSVILMLSTSPAVDAFFNEPEEPQKYVAQVKVFVDYNGRQKWKQATRKSNFNDLKADMQVLFDQMNSIFKGLMEYGLDFQLELKDVIEVLYYDNIIKPSPNYQIEPRIAVTEFGTWMSHRYHKQDFDMAFLFTGQDFVRGQSRTLGIAYATPGVCTAYGLGLMEMFGDLKADGTPISKIARVTAHEIGHLMGAEHDEDKSPCAHLTDYLMTYYAEDTDVHKYNFTECAYNSISKTIRDLTRDGKNCLLPSDSGLTEADVACQQREGSYDWYMARSYKEYGDKFCENLICIKYDKETKKRDFTKGKAAPDGMACGRYKECQKGKCVYTPSGDPTTPDNCPWGNQDLQAIGYNSNCEAQNCDKGWQHYCCAHCNAFFKEQGRPQQ